MAWKGEEKNATLNGTIKKPVWQGGEGKKTYDEEGLEG